MPFAMCVDVGVGEGVGAHVIMYPSLASIEVYPCI